ncbi:MFS transporter [Chromobacterium vaccinii]|uniref:MFS transporter n=1 Tax=Chromobacterium vaccinii TaxID=1108595 RepID=A0A1D9LG21_9NEIS|nr:MFS transporter [Chromobacterium vaccinii]AOZ50213.1 MFS transporter [Chromobacterium vaccinii]QND83542.1 putative MFS-type transporter [Chromobacterium vaccinii]QND88773.1 putative MFS-type transporter [Chromobacterium vaccinii]
MPQTALLDRLARPYRGLPPSVYIQVVCSFINNVGGISKLFLPLYLRENYHLPYSQIGMLMAFYGAGMLAGSLKGGSLTDRFDSRALAVLALAVSGLCMALLALQIPVWMFMPLLVLSGMADGGFRPINQRLALEPCTPQQRPVAQGMMRVAFNLGVAIAGVTSGFLAAYGYQWVYAANAAGTLLGASWMAWSYARHVESTRPQQRQAGDDGSLAGPWRDASFLRSILALVLVTLAFDQMYVTLALFLREHYQLGPQWVGYLFTINGLMVVALQIPVSRRILRWGLARSTQLGVLLTGCSFLWLNAGHGAQWAVLMMVTLTFGELLLSPSYAQLVMHRSEGRLRGSYLGLYNAAWNGRTLVAPALGTALYGQLGGSALWWLCALAACLSVAVQHGALKTMLDPAAETR